MGSIAVVIVVKNAESTIGECLDSVRWADEVVIVDSGSTDRTIELCRPRGYTPIFREWDGYAGQKNFSIDQATSNWILSLDADEVVTPELAEEIRRTVTSDARHPAYDIPRSNMFLGKWMRHGGWYPDRQLRLFRAGAGRFKNVSLHESLEVTGGAEIGHLTHVMRHYTYPTATDFILRADRYTTIECSAKVAEGRLPKSVISAMVFAVPLKFAEVYLYKGGWKDGVHGFIAAVLMSMRVFLRYVKLWEARDQSTERTNP